MELLDLEILRWAHGGDGIAIPQSGPLEGRVVFVPGAVPGDVITARVVHQKKRFARAELLTIVRPSPGRREAPCPVQDTCGGCPWMIGDQAVQIAARRQIVAGELRKALGWSEEQIDARLHMAAPAGGDLGYRQRIRLAWRRGPDGIRLGYRGRRSHEIIEIERCAVAAEPLNEALGDVRAVLADHGSREGEVTLLSGVHGVSWSLRGAGGVAAPGGVAEPVIHVQGRPLRVEASGFVQGNRAVTDAISAQVERVAREVAGHRALEFFAGVGTWTLALLEAGYTVEAYEGDGRAREAFLENTTHGEARFEVSDLLSLGVPEPPPQAADLLLLDPPRTGAAELMPWIRAIATPHVIFISCDVATGVRDLGALSGEGQPYDIDRITSYDMFPHTGHQELVIELSLRGSRC